MVGFQAIDGTDKFEESLKISFADVLQLMLITKHGSVGLTVIASLIFRILESFGNFTVVEQHSKAWSIQAQGRFITGYGLVQVYKHIQNFLVIFESEKIIDR